MTAVRSTLATALSLGIGGDIDVFVVAHTPSLVPQAELMLSDNELQRGRSFIRSDDRIGFLVARAALRGIVGERLGVDPRSVLFEQEQEGVLRLAVPAQRDRLSFTVSHADGLSLIGIAQPARALGIDVERRRDVPEALQIAGALFGAAAVDELAIKIGQDRSDTFMRLWTAGEALTKALGIGLAGWRHPIPVQIKEKQTTICDQFQCMTASPWKLQSLPLGPEWIASLAFASRAGGEARYAERAIAGLSI